MSDQVDELVAWTLRMSRAEREAEPIHVTRTSVWFAAIGFLALAVGESLICWAPTGGRLEFILLVLGTLSLAVAILYHLDHHRLRFGLPALIFFNLAIVAASAQAICTIGCSEAKGSAVGRMYPWSCPVKPSRPHASTRSSGFHDGSVATERQRLDTCASVPRLWSGR